YSTCAQIEGAGPVSVVQALDYRSPFLARTFMPGGVLDAPLSQFCLDPFGILHDGSSLDEAPFEKRVLIICNDCMRALPRLPKFALANQLELAPIPAAL